MIAIDMRRGISTYRRHQRQPYRRVIFCVVEGKMVLLHGFIKKTQKTPKADLDLALKRKKEVRT